MASMWPTDVTSLPGIITLKKLKPTLKTHTHISQKDMHFQVLLKNVQMWPDWPHAPPSGTAGSQEKLSSLVGLCVPIPLGPHASHCVTSHYHCPGTDFSLYYRNTFLHSPL